MGVEAGWRAPPVLRRPTADRPCSSEPRALRLHDLGGPAGAALPRCATYTDRVAQRTHFGKMGYPWRARPGPGRGRRTAGGYPCHLSASPTFRGRGPHDHSRTSWRGLAAELPGGFRLCFLGDTAWGYHLSVIGETCGLSTWPESPWAPTRRADPSRALHMVLEEALLAHYALRVTTSLAMHHAVFPVISDPIGEPAARSPPPAGQPTSGSPKWMRQFVPVSRHHPSSCGCGADTLCQSKPSAGLKGTFSDAADLSTGRIVKSRRITACVKSLACRLLIEPPTTVPGWVRLHPWGFKRTC